MRSTSRVSGWFLAIVIGLLLLSLQIRVWRLESKRVVLDYHTPMVVRYETAAGSAVRAPRLTTLGEYIELSDQTEDRALRSAIEKDLHAGDPTFHLTHETIDGKEW